MFMSKDTTVFAKNNVQSQMVKYTSHTCLLMGELKHKCVNLARYLK